MLTRIKEGSFSRSILKHNKGNNDAKCVNVNWLTTSKPDRLQYKMDIQILCWSHNYYPIYSSAKSTNQIYFIKPHHLKNHNPGSRYKSSRIFQLTPNIQRVLVRIKVMCAPDICSQKIVEGITWNRSDWLTWPSNKLDSNCVINREFGCPSYSVSGRVSRSLVNSHSHTSHH